MMAPVIDPREVSFADHEPRVLDLRLAALLGFGRPHTVRRLIGRNRGELEAHGAMLQKAHRPGRNFCRDGENVSCNGWLGPSFYLNEGQCLTLCVLARTPAAAAVRIELIKLFAWLRLRELRPIMASELAALVPVERRALRRICARGDIVTGPPFFWEGNGRTCDPAATRTYLVTPVDAELLDTLAAFEAEAADREQDDEPEDDDAGGADEGLDDNDGEPSLGAPTGTGDQEQWAQGASSGCELDTADDEPWLAAGCNGTTGASVDQTRWGRGSGDDRELDFADKEYSLGAADNLDQSHWGEDYLGRDLEADDAERDGDDYEVAASASMAPGVAPPPVDWSKILWTVNVDTGEVTPPKSCAAAPVPSVTNRFGQDGANALRRPARIDREPL